MGVDYTGNYGIGVELINVDFDEIGKKDYWMGDYVNDLPDCDKLDISYFEVGSENYGGNPNKFYLCIEEPFSDGVDGLKSKIETFKSYLSENKIEYIGDVDCVGGLNVW